ncbi:hypothetical protein EST38_g5724 [Candolleomyces aberdarensis]|uniref:Uncharacterized protein n=1 Tax=Candolleomyces aberdarensis TaxID=2316362 RepID=A0A4Q2DJQ9_9AGAR|nr:hypothetical protein EST38_g5724 [Candolleomyces aberdarensis]
MFSKLNVVCVVALALLLNQYCQAVPLPSDNDSNAAPPCESQPQAERGSSLYSRQCPGFRYKNPTPDSDE